MSLQSLPHLRQFAKVCGVCLLAGVAILLSEGVVTVNAQTPLVTPTPWPIVATRQAQADAQLAQAQAQQQQADQLDAQAAAMRHNADVQQAQAQQAINDARAAAASQNAAAVGEAIGRAESTLGQLRDTNAGQDVLLKEASNTIRTQAAQNISATNRIMALEVDKQVITANYNAATLRAADTAKQAQAAPIVTLVLGVLVLLAFVVVIIVILSRKKSPPQIVYDARRYEEAIENEAPP